jgi:fucose permease
MLIGRFRGDRIIDRIGESRLLLTSLGAVALGVGTLLVAPNAIVALVGFGLWGLGVSVMFPQIYLMAARANPQRPGAGLATMTLAQRGGFMAATASMGALSTGVGFGSAFAFMFIVAALFWLSGLFVGRVSNRSSEEVRIA